MRFKPRLSAATLSCIRAAVRCSIETQLRLRSLKLIEQMQEFLFWFTTCSG
jgi:hypothetical protein